MSSRFLFGAFVDIGVHQDGLVHISQLINDFVDDPRTVVNPGESVTVKVLGIDTEKKQISLTMKLEDRSTVRQSSSIGARMREGANRGRREGANNELREGSKQVADTRARTNMQNRQSDRSRPGSRPKAQPFNNPFAALQGIKK